MENIASLKEKWFKKEVERLTNDGVSKADIARALDIKPQYLNSILNGSRGLADTFLDKFIKVYDINQFDLLPHNNDSTVSTVSLRFMDKLDEKDNIINEKEAKIEELLKENGRLEERIKQLEAKNNESDSHLIVDKVTEAFTSESLGDYGEGFSHTNQSTISKISSAGKT